MVLLYPAIKMSRLLSRSCSSAVTGITRSLGACSSNYTQYRFASNEEFRDPGLSSSTPDDSRVLSSEPSLSLDSPATSDTPLPEKPAEDNRNYYPPRNFRSPRGVYKAIILGEVGQLPVQKILKSGRSVTIFSVGTGGMYNNRRPFEGESPKEFAERGYTQWHRIAVYQERVAGLVMQHVKVGSQVYLEGNIESRVYNDPSSGIVKRIREIAIRSNGRLMFMEMPTSVSESSPSAEEPWSPQTESAVDQPLTADAPLTTTQ